MRNGTATSYSNRWYVPLFEIIFQGERTKLIRTTGCSGSTTDRRNAMALLASNYENDPIDVLVGDWMSEGNMTGRANAKANGTYSFPRLRHLC
jgi:hypothetical protein